MSICNSFKLTSAVLSYFLFLMVSCSKPEEQINLDSTKIIDSVSIKKADGSYFTSSEIEVDIKGFAVDITVPFNTTLNPITPYFTIIGKTISPASGVPQDFTVPVVYTVTAEDGSTATYTVTVHLGPAPPIVYVGSSDNNFYALNALTGTLIWKYAGTASFAYSSATYSNGTVYVGGIDNYVYAFDASNGNIKWKNLIAYTGIESDAVYVNGTVYVGTNDDYLYALDANNGQEKWKYLTGANVSASPTVLNNVVYFGSSDGKLYALNASTGQLKWSYQTGAMINQSGPSLVNSVIYVGSRDGYLYAIDANSGALVWKYFANGVSLEQSSPTVANGIVYIGGWYDLSFVLKGSLYAINATTGELVWEKLLNTGISSSPCVANGRLYITADDLKIHALDATSGNDLWEKEILPNSASPAVSGGTVYVGGGGSHYFYAFDAVTGTENWKFAVTNGLSFSSPLIVTATGQADYSGDSGIAP